MLFQLSICVALFYGRAGVTERGINRSQLWVVLAACALSFFYFIFLLFFFLFCVCGGGLGLSPLSSICLELSSVFLFLLPLSG